MNLKEVLYLKTKLMWIPFIPLFMSGVLLRVYQAMFDPKGANAGLMEGGAITIGFAAIAIVTFLVIAIMSLLDKRTSAFYDVKKNIPAGVFAIIAGAFLFAGTVTSFLQGIDAAVLIDGLMSILGGAAIIIMGISSLSGNNKAKDMPVFMVMPALWGFTRTFITFLGDTAISTESKDMTDIVYMAFATMFLFSAAMVYTNIKGKNAVKGCFVYGLMTILITTAYTAAHLIYDLKNGSYSFIDNVETYQFFAIALFALFFLIELSYGVKERSKEEYEEDGIDTAKFGDVYEESEEDIDPDSLIKLSDDPLMLQAEEAMRCAQGSVISEDELKRYKDSIQDALDSGEYSDIGDFDSAEKYDEQYDADDEEPQSADFVETEYNEEHESDNQEIESDEKEVDAENKTDSASTDTMADDYDDISDIDLDSIEKLISEITGE